MNAIDESARAAAARHDEVPSHEAVVQALREEIVAISDGELQLDEIEPTGHLFDFGYVDSLRAVMLLAKIEERFGVEIEDMELVEELTTIEAIAARVRERASAT